jgi:RNA polymerase sigma-70 factor, ECF subfamily
MGDSGSARSKCWDGGMRAWPGIACNTETFWRIADRCVTLLSEQRATAVDFDAVNARDLYIVAALMDQQPGAQVAFDQAFLLPTQGAMTRAGLHAQGMADALQIIRERMLLPHDGQPPRILDVVGHGDLGSLFRVIALRTALNLRRTDERLDATNEDDAVFEKLISCHNPERMLIKQEARDLLKAAILSAVATLTDRDRTLLRLHFFHKLTIDDLGRMYDVHRATAARWLGKTHAHLDRETRSQLSKRMATNSDHLQSVLELAFSSLHSSFHEVWNELQAEG